MIDINYNDIAEVKRLVLYAQAKHITLRLLAVLDDYCHDSGVEIYNETDLPELMTSEIQSCLNGLKGD